MVKEKKETAPQEAASEPKTTILKSKSKREEEVNSLAILESDPLAIRPAELEQRMAIEQAKRKVLTDYISANMKEGKDYGSIKIEGRDGRTYESKNTLFKSGSEKFCSLFGLKPIFKSDIDTLLMLGNRQGVIAYICELMTKNGIVVGEGRGVADISEKRNWSLNNAVKIAEKRAQIDAVLRTGGLSDFFTQDLDDEAEPKMNEKGETEMVVSNKISQKQNSFLFAIMNQHGIPKEKIEAIILRDWNVIGIENLTKEMATKLIDTLLKKYPMPKLGQEGQKEEVPIVDLDKVDEEDMELQV